jgi:hypothetical protein
MSVRSQRINLIFNIALLNIKTRLLTKLKKKNNNIKWDMPNTYDMWVTD